MDIHKRNLSSHQKERIHKELTVFVESKYTLPKRYSVYTIKDNTFTLPLHWVEENLPELVDVNFNVNRINIKDSGITLRPLQEKCAEKCIKEFDKPYGGGIINLNTGHGKTVVSLYLISKFKYKTLIVVNTIELMNQWKAAIKQFLPDARIGIIQGGNFESKNKDITIAMIQTICKNYDKSLFKDFTTVFVDEVHHLSSEVFCRALVKIRTKYTFGLSATIERKDGLEKIFMWHLGPVLFSDAVGTKQKSIITRINYRGSSTKEMFMYNGEISVSKMITNLAEDTERTNKICEILKGLDTNRRVLVLSDRIKQLKQIHKVIGSDISGLFIGNLSSEERTESKSKRILLATYALASEGFNHPELNTLLFATPRSSITQAIGRIYRKHHDITPMIIDIVDTVGVFISQYRKRKAIYDKEIQGEKEPAVSLFVD